MNLHRKTNVKNSFNTRNECILINMGVSKYEIDGMAVF